MKRESDARRLLHTLLDRYERANDRSRRIISRARLSFESAEAHHEFDSLLIGASDAGAIEIIFDREAPHLIDKAILADPARLYGFLDRHPPEARLTAALSQLEDLQPRTKVGRDVVAYVLDRWRLGKSAVAIAPGNIEEAMRLVGAADAAFTDLPGGRVPLRTRSARLLNDSKALERGISKLLAFLKQTGRIPADLSRDEALRVLGLEKYPQPLLIAGPLSVQGVSIAAWTFVGLPPDAADDFEISGKVDSILTIENLESFNRHVRECRGPADAVVYTGGFPSGGVISAVRRLLALSDVPYVWHWGDIDAGGVKIGCYLERALSGPVVPHLMDINLAEDQGSAAPPSGTLAGIPQQSAFSPLAAYLASPSARHLEQEMLDPQPVSAISVPRRNAQ
jgi:hypothetical protein